MALAPLIFSIMAPVTFIAAGGFFWARLWSGFDRAFVGRLVMNVTGPCLILSTLGGAKIDAATIGVMLLGGVLATTLTTVMATAILLFGQVPVKARLPLIMFGNMGNIGLPLSLYAFGPVGLALASGLFVLNFIGQVVLGPTLMSASFRPLDVVRAPIVPAAIIAVTLRVADYALPDWLGKGIEMLGAASIPLMLMSLGHALGSLPLRGIWRAAPLALGRLALGTSGGLLAVWLLGLQALPAAVLVLQCSTPAGVFTYAIAERYDAEPAKAAQTVALSTLFYIIILPLILAIFLSDQLVAIAAG